MFRSRPVSLALVGLFLSGSIGCQKWVPVEPPYAPLQGESEELRITQEGGEQVVLEDARLAADSIFVGTASDPDRVVAIPVDSVQKIEMRQDDNFIGYVIGAAGVVGMVVLLMSQVEDPI